MAVAAVALTMVVAAPAMMGSDGGTIGGGVCGIGLVEGGRSGSRCRSMSISASVVQGANNADMDVWGVSRSRSMSNSASDMKEGERSGQVEGGKLNYRYESNSASDIQCLEYAYLLVLHLLFVF